MTKIRGTILTALFVITAIVTVYFLYPNKYILAMNKQVDWILNLQTVNGAIKDSVTPASYDPLQHKITPYYANIAATAITNTKGKGNYVKKYIQWYFSHLNWPDKNEINGINLYGTVYDYYVDSEGKEVSINDYDSADAYAATFLSLLRRYNETGGDVNFLRQNETKIDAIGKTIVGLMDQDGLTFAKPNYQIKFLMDNCEVYKGLIDISYIYEHVLLNTEKAIYYKQNGERVKNAIITNFLKEKEFYVYKDLNGYKKVDWNVWYPDSVSQIYPILFDVVEASDHQALTSYNMICKKWDWANLKASKDYPWVLMGFVGAKINASDIHKTFYTNIEIFPCNMLSNMGKEQGYDPLPKIQQCRKWMNEWLMNIIRSTFLL